MRRARVLCLTGSLLIASAWATASALAAGGGPLIPSGACCGQGVSGPVGEPSSQYSYVALGADETTIIARIKTDGGKVAGYRALPEAWALPAVTMLGEPSGLSADGETLVLIRPIYGRAATGTDFLILDTRNWKLRTQRRLSLEGRFSFDAISPDGNLLYLVRYPDPRDPLEYSVRAYDLAADEFLPGPIVDPEEPDEQMSGSPVAREASPDGRWAYTLYGGGEETFIHALDTEKATAVCIDLPALEGGNIYNLGLEVDPAEGAITVTRRGQDAALVDPETFEVTDPAALASTEGGDESGEADVLPWVALGGGIGLGALALLAVGRGRREAAA